jgi:hypothetical protein
MAVARRSFFLHGLKPIEVFDFVERSFVLKPY